MKALDSLISLELFLFHTSGFPNKDKTYKDNKASIRTNREFNIFYLLIILKIKGS